MKIRSLKSWERFALLIVLMTVTAMMMAGSVAWILYETAFDEEAKRLKNIVDTQGALIEAIAKFEARSHPLNHPEAATAAILNQITAAFKEQNNFGASGEFALARREGDYIFYLITQRSGNFLSGFRVRISSPLVKPMAQALSGQNGVLIAKDLRGTSILAAYRPLPSLKMGLVAKITLREIRAPFYRTGWIILVPCFASVFTAALLFYLLTRPIFRKVQHNEERLRSILETAADGIITINISGTLLTFNQAAERIFGYQAAEVIGKNVRMLMPSPDREQHDQYLNNYHVTGERKIIGSGREVRGLHKNGHPFPLRLGVSEVKGAGETTYIGIIHDLREYQRMETRMRNVVETAADGIITIDEKGQILTFNRAAENMFGYGLNEVVGQNVRMLMPSPDRENHDGYLNNYFTTGVKKIIGLGREVKGLRKDGTEFPLLLGVSEILDDSGWVFTGVVHDLTELHRMESRMRNTHSLSTLGMLARGIAHNFNNSFQIISSYLEILDRSVGKDEKARRAVTQIEKSIQKSTVMTQHLLSFSGAQEFNPAKVSLDSLLEGLGSLLEAALSKDVQLVVESAQADRPALGDSRALKNALLQLCLYTNSTLIKGGSITLSALNSKLAAERLAHMTSGDSGMADGEGVVLITIEGTGGGIPSEEVAYLFELVSDSDIPHEQERLGLAIAHGIIEQHQGLILVESSPGKRSQFSIFLPAFSLTAVDTPPEGDREPAP